MSSQQKPDFAYPKTVIADSGRRLEKALDKGDDVAALRCVADMALARAAISPDSIVSTLSLFRDVEAKLASSSAALAMLEVMEARILCSVYNSERYIFDGRRLPDGAPLPADPMDWDANAYSSRIQALLTKAMGRADVLSDVPLAKWKSLVEADALTMVYYPTLFDFVAFQACSIYRDIDARDSCHNVFTAIVATDANRAAPRIAAQIALIQEDGRGPAAIEALYSLYDAEKERTEFSGDILLAIGYDVNDDDVEACRRLRNAINANLRRWTAYPLAANLKDLFARTGRKRVHVAAPQVVAPGVDFTIDVVARNADTGYIRIFSIPTERVLEDRGYTLKDLGEQAREVGAIPFSLPDTVPFAAELKPVYRFDKPGTYFMLPCIGEDGPNVDEYVSVIYCTRLAAACLGENSAKFYALNLEDGAPVSGAEVFARKDRKTLKIGATNNNGFIGPSELRGLSYSRIYAVKDGSVSIPVYASFSGRSKPHEINDGAVFTDLPLYHRGDSLRFTAMAYAYGVGYSRVCASMPLKVTLRDANYDVVETLSLTSDDGGRVRGAFLLPDDRLTGSWLIELTKADDGNHLCSNFFTVSDYKLPTFRIEIDPIETTTASGAVLRGRVMGYNGMPVPDASLTVTLASSPRFRWWFGRRSEEQFLDQRLRTDADGRFALALTAEDFKGARYPDGLMKAEVTATSAAGETQTADCRFIMKAAYVLSANIKKAVDVSKGLKLTVTATDFEGKTASFGVHYRISPSENSAGPDRCFEGDIVTGNTLEIMLPAGAWTLDVTPDDDNLCEPLSMRFTAWMPGGVESPVKDVLWTPEESMVVEKGEADVIVYAARPTHILYSVYTPDKGLVDDGVIAVEAGRTLFTPRLPDQWESANVRMYAVAAYAASSLDINLTNKSKSRSLDVVVESFRDKIAPDAEETFTLRFNARNCKMPAMVALRVYNAALASLSSSPWSLSVNSESLPKPSWSVSDIGGRVYEDVFGRLPRTKVISVADPVFRTYGQSWSSGQLYLAFPMMKMAARAETTMVAMDMATADGAVNEATEEESASEATPQAAVPQIKFRDSELALAMFAPSLKTEDDGTLTVTYRVPNANATWLYEAVGWTADPVVSALWEATAVASRPIMVQPNVPRFLRKGDVAVVNTTVFNNSDNDMAVTVDIDVFDPRDNQPITSYTRTLMIAAGASQTVEAEIDTRGASYEGLGSVGFRVKAHNADGSGDGEQTLLRLLPAVGRVAESRTFWIAPSTEAFETPLPVGDDAEVNITLDSNPVAGVLSALPGLMNRPGTTSCSAAHAVFSTAIVLKLVAENPGLVLRGQPQWTLNKNVLSRTPWTAPAAEDTERAALLALLADGEEGAKAASEMIEKAVASLVAFECDGGGWRWSGFDSEMSLWATMNNLALLGRMHSLGADAALPAAARGRLDKMVRRAVAAMDAAIVARYKKNPEGNYMLYTLIRDMWTDVYRPSADADRVMSATVQQILGRWRDLDSSDKAIAALILEAHSYGRVAARIIDSIEEHSESSPEKGMWWPILVHRNSPVSVIGTTSTILDAWHAVAPQAPQIDLIRQWLILQKHTQNWGSSATTTDAIASILTTSKRWMKTPEADDVVMKAENGLLSIHRKAAPEALPLFGAVNSVYVPRVGSPVEAAPCQGIVSVEKRMARVADDGSLVEGPLAVGDRVRVTLNIKVEQALSYIVVRDNRPACFEPVVQMPSCEYAQTLGFYRENLDDATVMCFSDIPVGTYQISYDVFVNNSGKYTVPPAQLESQYAPDVTAHSSGGNVLKID